MVGCPRSDGLRHADDRRLIFRLVGQQQAAEVGATAILSGGLTKRDGDAAALDHLDLDVTQARWSVPRPARQKSPS
jgi:hypothetical protein